jgi:hypothetical protein
MSKIFTAEKKIGDMAGPKVIPRGKEVLFRRPPTDATLDFSKGKL